MLTNLCYLHIYAVIARNGQAQCSSSMLLKLRGDRLKKQNRTALSVFETSNLEELTDCGGIFVSVRRYV